MHTITELKQLEQAYNVAVNWYHKENIDEATYIKQIGAYYNFTPDEIVQEMCQLIRLL